MWLWLPAHLTSIALPPQVLIPPKSRVVKIPDDWDRIPRPHRLIMAASYVLMLRKERP